MLLIVASTVVRTSMKWKYSHLESSYCFIPVAVETLGVFGPEAGGLVKDLGRRIAHAT